MAKLAVMCCVCCLCCLTVPNLWISGNFKRKTSMSIRNWKTKSISEPEALPPSGVRRRRLVGPGSFPPRCTSKCGRCSPCRPVHVPVPPGTPVTTEYYPEAWRCKCGNRLYMP